MKQLFLTVITVFLVSVGIITAQSNANKYLVKVGDMAPDFEMLMPDATSIKLSALRGKVVMLQFTASWCGVCHKEMPFIESEIWQNTRTIQILHYSE